MAPPPLQIPFYPPLKSFSAVVPAQPQLSCGRRLRRAHHYYWKSAPGRCARSMLAGGPHHVLACHGCRWVSSSSLALLDLCEIETDNRPCTARSCSTMSPGAAALLQHACFDRVHADLCRCRWLRLIDRFRQTVAFWDSLEWP